MTKQCPECGGRLVERVATKSKTSVKIGSTIRTTQQKSYPPFLGCSNYPKCDYIEEL